MAPDTPDWAEGKRIAIGGGSTAHEGRPVERATELCELLSGSRPGISAQPIASARGPPRAWCCKSKPNTFSSYRNKT